MKQKIISNELQSLIDSTLKGNEKLEYQICKNCNREFPVHTNFFIQRRNMHSKFNFSFVCKECDGHYFSTDYDLLKNVITELYIKSINENKPLPPGFWTDKDHVKIVIRYLCQNVYNFTEQDIYKKVNDPFLSKHRCKFPRTPFDSLYDLLVHCFPEHNILPWFLNNTPKSFWNNDENKVRAIKWLVEQLIDDKIINSLAELPKKSGLMKIINKYRLGGLLNHRFSGNIYEMFNFAYPGKWNPWDMAMTSKNFYLVKENRIIAVRDVLINKLNFKSKEDFLNISKKHFESNGLDGLLVTYFNSSPIQCIKECFPEYEFNDWEFQNVQLGYWKNPDTRNKALKTLVEDVLNIKHDQIPLLLSRKFLSIFYPKFHDALGVYYNYNLFQWINDVYPSKFKLEDFYQLVTIDGIRVDSREELIIHNYMIDNITNKKIEHTGNKRLAKYKFHNKSENEKYVPDWILNKNIIIEYFGWYNADNTNEIFINYTDKANRKIKYFSSLSNYKFIALFPEDLKNNLQGVREKLNNIFLQEAI